MPNVVLPVLRVKFSQLLIMDHEQILRIVLLCRFGKVERPSCDGFSVDDHDLVMCDGYMIIRSFILVLEAPKFRKKGMSK